MVPTGHTLLQYARPPAQAMDVVTTKVTMATASTPILNAAAAGYASMMKCPLSAALSASMLMPERHSGTAELSGHAAVGTVGIENSGK